MPSRPIIELFCAANARFVPGLLVALGTALAHASGQFDYNVSILHEGLGHEVWVELESRLERLAERRRVRVCLRRIAASGGFFDTLPTRRGSRLTYARLAVPYLTEAPKAVYLDSDVVCFRGVELFWSELHEDVALTAVRDPLGVLGRDDSLRRRVPRARWALPYFNTGIIGIHCKHWRRAGVAALLTRSDAGVQPDYRYADQSLLNQVFCARWHELPASHNLVLTLEASANLDRLEEAPNLHFVGPQKPWMSPASRFYRCMADHLFDRAYQWVCGGAPPPRHPDARSLAAARRKALVYRLLRPARARQYAAAAQQVPQAALLAARFWEKFGPA